MSEESRGCRKSCLLGCGLFVLVAFVGLAVVGVRTCVPLRSASRDLGRLEARFGPPESFTPAPDGAIPAARIGRFLLVRQSLRDSCETFEALLGKVERVEQFDEDEPPSGREIAGTTRGLAEVAAGIARVIGEFFAQRNRALLEAEMGLGEYTYIYVLSYGERFLDPSIREELFCEGGPVPPEVQTTFLAMLNHQLAALSAAAGVEETGRRLREEIEAMERDPQRLPWQDGLPGAVEASLAPFRVQLDAAYCRATTGIEMDRDSKRAMVIALH